LKHLNRFRLARSVPSGSDLRVPRTDWPRRRARALRICAGRCPAPGVGERYESRRSFSLHSQGSVFRNLSKRVSQKWRFYRIRKTVSCCKSTEPQRKMARERPLLPVDGLSESRGSAPKKPNSALLTDVGRGQRTGFGKGLAERVRFEPWVRLPTFGRK